jgi:uncharacterized protein YbaR (Trm112 family)
MACREFTLWYNGEYGVKPLFLLWLVGNSRYDTINSVFHRLNDSYGLSGIHAMIQLQSWPKRTNLRYGLSGIHAMIQWVKPLFWFSLAMACREFTLWYNTLTNRQFRRKAMACREFTLWYNIFTIFSFQHYAMACREFTLWYNQVLVNVDESSAMACREFTLWYNLGQWVLYFFSLWLVGNSRYDTMESNHFFWVFWLWLVGNSRYDTIKQNNSNIIWSYGLSGIHAMIQSEPNHFFGFFAMACREFTLWYNRRERRVGFGNAMACREFTLWYNAGTTSQVPSSLWLVGNSRYDTMRAHPPLWWICYGLSGIHAMIQWLEQLIWAAVCYGLSGIHAMIQF